MNRIAVIIADLIRSKEVENRAKIQRELKKALEEVGSKHSTLTLAPLAVVRGDEFEGAFKDAQSCYEAFEEVERSLYPNQIRGGIGFGDIDTDFSETVTEMDGPAFHRARKALEEVKGSKSGLIVHTNDAKLDDVLNTILRLLWAVKNGWTDRQREVVNLYFTLGAPTHAEIADHLGISQPAVSKILSAAHLGAVEDARKFLLRRLSTLRGD